MSQKQELDKLAIEWEQKLKFIGILGLKKSIHRKAEDFIDLINDLDINTCLLSGDRRGNIENVVH